MRMAWLGFGWWAFAALGLAACSTEAPEDPSKAVDSNPGGTVEPPTEPPRMPALKRLSVDELQLTVSIVAGTDETGQPIHWMIDKGGKQVDAYSYEGLGEMMGRPNYYATTAEATAPDMLYAKFARDMAREVCDAMVQADLARSADFTLWRYAPVSAEASEAEVTANLQYLILRFHGLRYQAGDPQLESYRQVYAASRLANPTPSEADGWRGVCIALFEDPAFHLH